MVSPCTESNPWITLTQNTAGQLQATPVASPRQGNSLRLEDDGIFVPGYVSQQTRPVGAQDGDLWTYWFDASPVEWNFVYRTADGGWVWHGGGDLSDEVDVLGTRAGSASPVYGNLTVGGAGGTGPTVTLPFAGTYVFWFGAEIGAAANGVFARAALEFGGVAALDADSVLQSNDFISAAVRRMTRTVSADGTSVVMRYKNLGGGGGPDAQFGRRYLAARPLILT